MRHRCSNDVYSLVTFRPQRGVEGFLDGSWFQYLNVQACNRLADVHAVHYKGGKGIVEMDLFFSHMKLSVGCGRFVRLHAPQS